MKNTQTKIKDVMLKVRGKIEVDVNPLDVLKMFFKNKITVIPVFENGKVVGVVRDSDMFLATAGILME